MPWTTEQKRAARNLEKVRENLLPELLNVAATRDEEAGKNRYKSEVLSQTSLAKIYTGVPWKDNQEEEDRRTSSVNKKKKKIINPSAEAVLGITLEKHSTMEELIADFDKWLELRDRARKDLFWLGKVVLKKDLEPTVHQVVCDQFVKKNFDGAFPEGYSIGAVHDAIDRQERFDADGRPTKEMILLDSRGFYKSTIDGIDAIQWMLNVPDIRILLLTGEYKLGVAFLKEIKGYLYLAEGAEATDLNLLFPEYIVRGVDGTSKEPLTLDVRKHNQTSPTLWVNSIDSNLSGWHCDVKKGDDVVTDANSNSEDVRIALKEKFDGTNNILDDWGFSDNIGTRYFPKDWYGTRLESYRDNPEENPVKLFCRACWTVKPEYVEVPLKELTAEMVNLTFPQKRTFKILRGKLLNNEREFRCFPAGSVVLMSDWTEKNIENIVPGDEIIGFDNGLQKTTVTHVHSKRDVVVKATTETGRVVFATKDHEFLKPINRKRKQFGHLRIGRSIVSVYDPPKQSEDQQRILDWLSGILDGEGSCSSQVCIYQSEITNPVMCTVIRERLITLGISFKESLDSRRGVVQFKLSGGRSLKIRLLQQTVMARKQRVIDSLWESSQMIAESSGRRGGSSYERVISIEEIGEQQVYDLTTGTSNYVCQGFAVHNCQQLNEPAGLDKDDGFRVQFDENILRARLIANTVVPREGDIYICWDWALSSSKYSDYSVGVAGRVCLKDGLWSIYILEIIYGRWRASELAFHIVSFNKKWNPKKTLIEKSNGSELLNLEIIRQAARFETSIDVFWKPPALQDNAKRNRIKGLEALLADNRLFFVIGAWIDETFSQLIKYTGEKKNRGRKDDIPDAMSYLSFFLPSSLGGEKDSEEMQAVVKAQKEQYLRKKNYERYFGGPMQQPVQQPVEAPRQRRPGDIFGGNGLRAL